MTQKTIRLKINLPEDDDPLALSEEALYYLGEIKKLQHLIDLSLEQFEFFDSNPAKTRERVELLIDQYRAFVRCSLDELDFSLNRLYKKLELNDLD